MDKWSELGWCLAAYAAVAGVALGGLAGLWFGVPRQMRRLLPLVRQPRVPWTGHEVFLAFCVFWGLQNLIPALLLVVGFFDPLLGPSPELKANDSALSIYLFRCLAISSPLILAMSLALVFGIVYARTQTRPHGYGLTRSRWAPNVALGLMAFLVSTLMILGLHALVVMFFPERPHFLVEFARQEIPEWQWLLVGFLPVVMAPIMEEIVFRGILLGWLSRASLFGHTVVVSVTLLKAASNVTYHENKGDVEVFDVAPFVFAGVLVLGYCLWLYRLSRQFTLDEAEMRSWRLRSLSTTDAGAGMEGQANPGEVGQESHRNRQWVDANRWLAIYGSAMIFAVFHSESWPSPVALLPMGLILAWLAGRTHSLVGPITFHALFNLVSFFVLYGSVHYGGVPNGNSQATANRPSVEGSVRSSVPGVVLPLRR